MSIEEQYKRLKPLKSIAGFANASFKIYPGDEVTLELGFESGHRLEVTAAKLNLNEIVVRIFRADGRSNVALHPFLEGNLHLIAKHLKENHFDLASKVLKTQAVVEEEVEEFAEDSRVVDLFAEEMELYMADLFEFGSGRLALNEFPPDLYLKIKECADKAMASRRIERQAAKWLAGEK